MSRGSILSAAGSTMMWPRSTDCMPSFSDSASRSVASDTKPSCTSSRPTGTCDFVCSSSAMRSWSSVRIPWSIRIWPICRFAWGLAGEFILVGELRDPVACGCDIEARAALLGEGDGASVVVEREPRLAQVVQADRQVVREVRVLRVGGKGPEVCRLRFRPAALLGELVTEGEVQRLGVRIGGKHGLYAAFSGKRVQAACAQRDKRRLRMRVSRIGLQQAQVDPFGRLEAPGAHVDRCKPEKRIAVAALVAQRSLVIGARGSKVASE